MASIALRPNGRYRARYRDDDGCEHAQHFRTKAEGELWLKEQGARLIRGEWVDPRRAQLTVAEWSETWMAGRVHLKPKTVAGYESLLRVRVLPKWGKVKLSKVTHGQVVAWVSKMRRDGLSPSQTRQAYHLLTSMLDDAVKDNRLVKNPAAGVKLPRMPMSERRYLSHNQVSELADAAGPYRLLVLVLAYCGVRWGEAAALRVRHVDLLRGRLDISEAVVDVNGHMIFGAPKSHQRRSVPIPKFLRDDLAGHMAGKGPADLVFTAPRGAVLRVQNFRRRCFDAAAASVGLEGLVPHELRHTAASLAISAGARVKVIQQMLGHGSAALTLDRYGHLFGDDLDDVGERLGEARNRDAADKLRTAGRSEVVSITGREA